MPVAIALHSRTPRRSSARLGKGRLLPFTAPGQNTERFFRPELDALRLFAFGMVWSCHSLPAAAECVQHGWPAWAARLVEIAKETGNLGVPVFFFLSAYLITELLRREWDASGTIAVGSFYLRRILRIWPLYLGVLALYGLLGLRFHGFRIEPGRLLASVFMVGNWYIAFHPALLTPMRALWSLSVEEQFYAAWPLLARSVSQRMFLAVCAALVLLGQATLVFLAGHSPALHVTAWVNSLVQFQFFALGAGSALLAGGRLPRFSRLARILLAAGALCFMLCSAGLFGIKHPQPEHSAPALCLGYLCAGLGCVLLLGAVLGLAPDTFPRPLRKLGQISFGLYVFHETGFFFADALLRHVPPVHGPWLWAAALAVNKALALLLTIGMALLSYTWWEKPFLRWKERFTIVRSRRA